jgi:hypothetical protein
VPDKASLLALLQSIATGPPYLTEHHTWMEAVLAEEGRNFQAEIELAQEYAQHARDAVAEGLDVYMELLDDEDTDTREWAFALLSALLGDVGQTGRMPFTGKPETILLLLARLRQEPDPDLKAQLIEHLGLGLAGLPLLPGEAEEPVAELLERLVRSGETAMARFVAAVALADLLGAETPALAGDILESAILHPAGLYPGADLARDAPSLGEALVVEEARAALDRIDPGRRSRASCAP